MWLDGGIKRMENRKKGSLQDAKWTMEVGGMVGLKKEGKQGSDGFLNGWKDDRKYNYAKPSAWTDALQKKMNEKCCETMEDIVPHKVTALKKIKIVSKM